MLQQDRRQRQHLERLDGKLLVVTNVVDDKPAAVIERYKGLADIERGFRTLKSDIEIGPIFLACRGASAHTRWCASSR